MLLEKSGSLFQEPRNLELWSLLKVTGSNEHTTHIKDRGSYTHKAFNNIHRKQERERNKISIFHDFIHAGIVKLPVKGRMNTQHSVNQKKQTSNKNEIQP